MKRCLFVVMFVVSLCPNLLGRGCPLSGETIKIAVLSDVHMQDTSYVRSMDAQLHSTRLFNENYFAFISALDDIAKRNIHYVLLPGDQTDDGQLINVRKVREILDSYSVRYNMHFFMMTGNHDPARPFSNNDQGEMKKLGYNEIHNEWASFGFYPQKEYQFWATPFSTYTYENYTYDEAAKQADWSKRTYAFENKKPAIQDGSYLVEPVKGLWLLAIDASVYYPQTTEGDSILTFEGARSVYNEGFKAKPYLFPWITKVAAQAKKYGKKLVTFSHFPMADYNDGVAQYIPDIAAPGKFDMYRFPNSAMAQLLADAGITLHLGGHMHMNDEQVSVSKKGNRLLNIQVPSTAGYVPGYKILKLNNGTVEAETISLDTVKGFNSFFSRYRAEHDSLQRAGKQPLWDESILNSKNYRQFCEAHLRELTRLRYLPNDFKPMAKERFASMKASELFAYANIKSTPKSADWTGFDMLVDFYKLRFGGKLALKDIDSGRLKQYKEISCKVVQKKSSTDFDKFMVSFCRIFLAQMEDGK
nr:metallophosphoesterase [uncultured Bacteroides sp.]